MVFLYITKVKKQVKLYITNDNFRVFWRCVLERCCCGRGWSGSFGGIKIWGNLLFCGDFRSPQKRLVSPFLGCQALS